jgi:hypothetical protein
MYGYNSILQTMICMKSMLPSLLVETSYDSVDVSRRNNRLHLKGRKVMQARYRQAPLVALLLAGFLFHLLCDPEDGDDTFLRNVGGLLPI